MSMLAGTVDNLVRKYLGEYFSYDKLEITGLGRHVAIRNLKLKSVVIPPTLFFSLDSCTVGLIDINIAPLSLFSSSPAINATINDLNVELRLRNEDEWDEIAEMQALKAAKLGEANALRQILLSTINNVSSESDGFDINKLQKASDSAVMSFIKSLIVKVFGNVELLIQNIHLKYRFEVGNQKGEIGFMIDAIGVTSDGFQEPKIPTTNTEEDELVGLPVNNIEGKAKYIANKVITIQKISIYCESQKSRNHFVRPFDVDLILQVNLAANPGSMFAIVDTNVSEIVLDITPVEIVSFNGILESLQYQAEWQRQIGIGFKSRIQTGVTASDRTIALDIYERMLNSGSAAKAAKDPSLVKPKADAKKIYTTTVEAFFSDLSWLEAFELKAPIAVVKSLLNSAGTSYVRAEKRKLDEKQLASTNEKKTWSAYLPSFLRPVSADSATNREDAVAASNMTNALGIDFSSLASDEDETEIVDEAVLKQRFKAVFNSIDLDGSGDIDASELRQGLAAAGTFLSVNTVLSLMNKFDTDNSGTVDFEEFCELCMLSKSILSSEQAADEAVTPVTLLMFSIDAISVIVSSTPDRTEASQLSLTISAIDAYAAIEDVEKAAIMGRKAIHVTVEGMNVDVGAKALKTLPLLTSDFNQSEKDILRQETGQLFAKTEVTMEVVRVNFTDNQIKDGRLPYCIVNMNDYQFTTPVCNEQASIQVEIENKNSSYLYDSSMLKQSFKVNYLTNDNDSIPDKTTYSMFTAKNENKQILSYIKNPSFHIKINTKKAKVRGAGWFSSVMTESKSSCAVLDDSDVFVASCRGHLPFETHPIATLIKKSNALLGKSISKNQWISLHNEAENQVGQVLVRIRKKVNLVDEGGNAVDLEQLQPRVVPMLSLETILQNGSGYLDVATGISLKRFEVLYHPDIFTMLNSLSEAFIPAPVESKVVNDDEEPLATWRFAKSLVKFKFFGLKGRRDLKYLDVFHCKLICGSETVGNDIIYKEELSVIEPLATFILGDTQSLSELVYHPSKKSPAYIEVTVKYQTPEQKSKQDLTYRFDLHSILEASKTLSCIPAALYSSESLDELIHVRTQQHPNIEVHEDLVAMRIGFDCSWDVNESIHEHIAPSLSLQSDKVLPPITGDFLGLSSFIPNQDKHVAVLNVVVISAKNLDEADYGGGSDPYCITKCCGDEKRTQVVQDSVNPVWANDADSGSIFMFGPLSEKQLGPDSSDMITFTVKDHDVGGDWTDDLLGVTHVPLNDIYKLLTKLEEEENTEDDLHSIKSKIEDSAKGSNIVINDDVSTTIWLPLHVSTVATLTGGSESRDRIHGEILVKMWLSPYQDLRPPLPTIPIQIDASILLQLELPAILIPENNPLNATGRAMAMQLGSPNLMLQVNGGAKASLIKALSLRNSEIRLFSPASRAVKENEIYEDTEETALTEGDLNTTFGTAFTHDTGNDSRLTSDKYRSFVTSRSRQGSDEQSWYSASNSWLDDDFESAKSEDDNYMSPVLKRSTSAQEQENTKNALMIEGKCFAIGVVVKLDALAIQIMLAPPRRRKRSRASSVRVRNHDCVDEVISVCLKGISVGLVGRAEGIFGRSSARFHFALDELALVDGIQRCKIISCNDTFNDDQGTREQPHQIVICGTYGLPNELFERHRASPDVSNISWSIVDSPQYNRIADVSPSFLLGIQIDGIFILASPLMVLGLNVLDLFDLTALEGGETVVVEEPQTAVAVVEERSFALPVSEVKVSLKMSSVELHIMRRKQLRLDEYGRLQRFPPKSVVVRLEFWFKYTTTSDTQRIALPLLEKIDIGSTLEILIKRTNLERHMYTEEPSERAENVILEPFSVLLEVLAVPCHFFKDVPKKDDNDKVDTDHMRIVDNLRKYEAYLPELELSGDKVDSFAETWNSDDQVIKSRDLVDSFVQDAVALKCEIIRDVVIKLIGLEVKLDTGDYKFVLEVVQSQMDILFPSPTPEQPSSPKLSIEKQMEQNLNFIEKQDDVFRKVSSANRKASQVKGPISRMSTLESVSPVYDQDDILQQTSKMVPGWLFTAFVPVFVLCHHRPVEFIYNEAISESHVDIVHEGRFLCKKADKVIERINGGIHTFHVIDVKIRNILCGLGNNVDGYPTPFLRLEVNEIICVGGSHTLFMDDIQMSGHLSISGTCFNSVSKAWEPFIEYWTLRYKVYRESCIERLSNCKDVEGDVCELEEEVDDDFSIKLNHSSNSYKTVLEQQLAKKKEKYSLLVQMVAHARLVVNITDSFLSNISFVMLFFDPSFVPLDDERLHGPYCPNWVVNDTGHSMEVWPIRYGGEDADNITSMLQDISYPPDIRNEIRILDVNEASEIHLYDNRRMHQVGKRLIDKYVTQAKRNRRKILRQKDNKKEKKRFQLNGVPGDSIRSILSNIDDGDEGELQKLFAILDQDHSGLVSAFELQKALATMGETLSIEEVIYELKSFILRTRLENEEVVQDIDVGKGDELEESQHIEIDMNQFLQLFSFVKAVEASKQYKPVCALGLHFGELGIDSSGLQKKDQFSTLAAPVNAVGEFMLVNDRIQAESTLILKEKKTMKDLSKEKAKQLADKALNSFKKHGNQIDLNLPDALNVVGIIKKMGRSSAGNVLFLETPLRIENRIAYPLQVCLIPVSSSIIAQALKIDSIKTKLNDCDTDEEELQLVSKENMELEAQTIGEAVELFTLFPGEENSIPLTYMQPNSHFKGKGMWSIQVRPILPHEQSRDRPTNKNIDRLKRRSSSSSSATRSKKFNRHRTLSQGSAGTASSAGSQLNVGQECHYTEPLVAISGGSSILNLVHPSKDDKLSKKEVAVLHESRNDNNQTTEGILHADRVSCFQVWNEEDTYRNRFEFNMLTQRNCYRKFEVREVLTVQVVKATNLVAADRGGSSDPYVRVTCGKEDGHTPVIPKTLNPVWPNNATFRFGETQSLKDITELKIKVGDKDTFGKNDPLGYVTLKMSSIRKACDNPNQEVYFHELVSNPEAFHGFKDNTKEPPATFEADGRWVKEIRLGEGPGVKREKIAAAKSKITLAFKLERASVVSETIRSYMQHTISFYPSYVIKNLLPHRIQLKFTLYNVASLAHTSSRDKLYEVIKTYPAGCEMADYDIDGALFQRLGQLRHGLKLMTTKVASITTNTAKSLTSSLLHNSSKKNENSLILEIQVRLDGDSLMSSSAWSPPIMLQQPITLYSSDHAISDPISSIKCDLNRNVAEHGGARCLNFSSSLWIINKSGLSLRYNPKTWPYSFDDTRKQHDDAIAKTLASEVINKLKIPSFEFHAPDMNDICCMCTDPEQRLIISAHTQTGIDVSHDPSKPIDLDDDKAIKMGEGAVTLNSKYYNASSHMFSAVSNLGETISSLGGSTNSNISRPEMETPINPNLTSKVLLSIKKIINLPIHRDHDEEGMPLVVIKAKMLLRNKHKLVDVACRYYYTDAVDAVPYSYENTHDMKFECNWIEGKDTDGLIVLEFAPLTAEELSLCHIELQVLKVPTSDSDHSVDMNQNDPVENSCVITHQSANLASPICHTAVIPLDVLGRAAWVKMLNNAEVNGFISLRPLSSSREEVKTHQETFVTSNDESVDGPAIFMNLIHAHSVFKAADSKKNVTKLTGYNTVQCELALFTSPLFNELSNTTVLTITPKYVFANVSDLDILIKQEGAPASSAILLRHAGDLAVSNGYQSAFDYEPFHFSLTPGTQRTIYKSLDEASNTNDESHVTTDDENSDDENDSSTDSVVATDLNLNSNSSSSVKGLTTVRKKAANLLRKKLEGIKITSTNKVQLRVLKPGSQWTSPFALDEAADFALQFRDADGNRDCKAWIDLNRITSTKCVVIRPLPDSSVRLLINNMSGYPIYLGQVHIPKKGVFKKLGNVFGIGKQESKLKLNFKPDCLKPGEKLPFALDIPTIESKHHSLAIFPEKPASSNVVGPDGEEVDDLPYVYKCGVLVKIQAGKKYSMKIPKPDGTMDTIFIEQRVYGARINMDILHQYNDDDDTVDESSDSEEEESSDEENENEPSKSKLVVATAPASSYVDFCFHLSSVGISIFSSHQACEIAFIVAQRIHLEMALESCLEAGIHADRVHLEACLGHLQIDSSRRSNNSKFPVMLASRTALKNRGELLKKEDAKERSKTIREEHLKYRTYKGKPIISSVSLEAQQHAPNLMGPKLRFVRRGCDFMNFQLIHTTPIEKGGFAIVNFVTLRLLPIDFKLDGVFLAGLLAVLRAFVTKPHSGAVEGEGEVLEHGKRLQEQEWIKAIKDPLVEPLVIPGPDTMFIEKIYISPMLINISVLLGSPKELKEMFREYDIPTSFISIINTLAKLEGFNFDLPSANHEKILLNTMIAKYSSKVTSAVISQLAEAVFNFVQRGALFLHISKSYNYEPIRLPLVPVNGAVTYYGPGERPRYEDLLNELAAVAVFEKYYKKVLEKRHRAARKLRIANGEDVSEFYDSHVSEKERKEAEQLFGNMVDLAVKKDKSKCSCCFPFLQKNKNKNK